MKRYRILIPAGPFLLVTIVALSIWMKQPPPALLPATPGAGPLQKTGTLPDFAQPAVAGLVAEVHRVRIDPAAKPDQTFTTGFHPSGVLRYIGMEPGWSLGTLPQGQPVTGAVRE